MNPEQALIDAARSVLGVFKLDEDFSAGSAAAALRTKSGKVFTGICLDFSCGLGFCAEHSAIAEMLKARESTIAVIVAVSEYGIIPPCGRCRELMMQVNRENLNTRVLLAGDKATSLAELLPHHWR